MAIKKETKTVKKTTIKTNTEITPKTKTGVRKKCAPKTKDTNFATSKDLASFIIKKLDEGKADKIEQIEVVGRTTLTDYFIIATGTSSRHVFGLANNLAQDMKKAGHRVQVAGDTGDGNWIVVDAGDVIVHLFTSEMREIYNIEGNWKKSE